MRIKQLTVIKKKPSVRLSNREQFVGRPYYEGMKQHEYT
jgi:hypothetical protein